MKLRVSKIFDLTVLLLVMIFLRCTEATVQHTTQQLKVQQLLKRLNKPAVKTIKSPDGDIIDCVHIAHQPAFDHPLLKNHTIQMRPTFYPSGLVDENKVASEMENNPIPQLWQRNGRCPDDTIPIRRTRKEDVLRALSVESFGKKSRRTIRNTTAVEPKWNNIAHEHAIVHTNKGSYFGAKASLNVWNPTVQEPSEYSTTQFWILGGPTDSMDSIEAGWHVSPSLYGDGNTRLFTHWTADGSQKTGCFNVICPGFVQVRRDVVLGAKLEPSSSYNGTQYVAIIVVWKDPNTKNWWLSLNGNYSVGYWPSRLFPNLKDKAEEIRYGGEVLNLDSSSQHTTTQMGSGHFPGAGWGRASFVRDLRIVDKSNGYNDPGELNTLADRSSCYNIAKGEDGIYYYGGRGRNVDCP